jgi:hypothetical protein
MKRLKQCIYGIDIKIEMHDSCQYCGSSFHILLQLGLSVRGCWLLCE